MSPLTRKDLPPLTPGPFLRWAGGKQWVSHAIAAMVPRTYGTYFEPFLGGASVFLKVKPQRAILGDLNPWLIDAYTAIRDVPEAVLHWLSKWDNSRETYLQLRSSHFTSVTKRAAQLIYLNKTCWNGLFRVNRRGHFNVPYGNSPERKTHAPCAIFNASMLLKGASLACSDFEPLLENAVLGDLVYLDPPYTLLHRENGFRRYNENLFNWEDQRRLASVAHRLVARGCYVLLTNAYHSDVLHLYPDFKCHVLNRRSSLAANPTFRRQTQELLLISPNLAAVVSVTEERKP